MKQHHAGGGPLQRGGGQMQHPPQRFARGVGEVHKSLNDGILHRTKTLCHLQLYQIVSRDGIQSRRTTAMPSRNFERALPRLLNHSGPHLPFMHSR